MKLLLLGATGLVGSHLLRLALKSSAYGEVIAPTRVALAPSDKLVNPVAPRLDDLIETTLSRRPDVLICALGTTQAKAGSRQAFRHVDYDLPIEFGKAALAAGVDSCAIVTAMGASAHSMSFLSPDKGRC